MYIGTCVTPKLLNEAFPEAEYVELPARDFFDMEKAQFDRLKAAVAEGRMNAYGANCLTPRDMRLTGPDVDMAAIKEFVSVVFEKLATIGVKLVVFGAGPSKNVPEGFSREKAWDQLYELGRMFAELSSQYGQTIAVEPLFYKETNIVNTVVEAASFVETVNLPNFKCMVDFFHFTNNAEDPATIFENIKHIVHAHIAVPVGRTPPRCEEDWAFFRKCLETLKTAGYTGGLSFEGSSQGADEINNMLIRLKQLRLEVGA